MKQQLNKFIDSISEEIIKMADYIFDNPEIGLQEYKASKLLLDYLTKNGFTVEKGIAEMDTAFRAVYENGHGGPSIGLLCEYDALEGLGHACAHHMQGPAIVGTAVALKEVIKDMPYKIVVYGTPAEETIGGKIKMLEHGYFRDIDIALMMHGSPTTTTDIKSLAMSNFRVAFKGKSAHAAVKPEDGRSALDALILLFQGIEFLREHVKDDVRIHYVVTNGGGAVNIVPSLAEGKFSLRSYNRLYLDEVIERFKKVVQGAALMTETDFQILEEKSLDNKIPVIKLNDILMENAKNLNAPNIRPPREKTGSSDFGNVMYNVPGSCIRIAFVPEGTSSHSEQYIQAGKTKAAHDAIILAAKILSATCYDIISNKTLLTQIKEEFEMNKRRAENA
ncbi:MAG: M20 family metallopeptidase [Clostridiales bacterium]|nr:M20 family metallopeptidase [Clostridiales bacterium]